MLVALTDFRPLQVLAAVCLVMFAGALLASDWEVASMDNPYLGISRVWQERFGVRNGLAYGANHSKDRGVVISNKNDLRVAAGSEPGSIRYMSVTVAPEGDPQRETEGLTSLWDLDAIPDEVCAHVTHFSYESPRYHVDTTIRTIEYIARRFPNLEGLHPPLGFSIEGGLEGLKALSKLPRLQEIYLPERIYEFVPQDRGAPASRRQLPPDEYAEAIRSIIRGMKSVTLLGGFDVGNSLWITDLVKQLSDLRVLILGKGELPSGSWEELGKLTDLRTLALGRGHDYDNLAGNLKHLKSLPKLEALCLEFTGDMNLAQQAKVCHAINGLKHIRHLRLPRLFYGDGTTDAYFKDDYVELTANKLVTLKVGVFNARVAELVARQTSLQRLSVELYPNMSDPVGSLTILAGLKQLRTLHIDHRGPSGAGNENMISYYAELPRLDIHHLSFTNSPPNLEEIVAPIIDRCPELRVLSIRASQPLGQAMLRAVSRLEHLTVLYAPLEWSDALPDYLAQMDSLEVLKMPRVGRDGVLLNEWDTRLIEALKKCQSLRRLVYGARRPTAREAAKLEELLETVEVYIRRRHFS